MSGLFELAIQKNLITLKKMLDCTGTITRGKHICKQRSRRKYEPDYMAGVNGWHITLEDGSHFGTWRTKQEALEDARAFGVKIIT